MSDMENKASDQIDAGLSERDKLISKLDIALEAMESISNQGFISTKLEEKRYVQILDEYKEIIDQALQKMKEIV